MEQERQRDQTTEVVDIVTHQIGIQTKNVQAENHCAIFAKRRHFAKACIFEHRKRQEIKENAEPEETGGNDSDKLANIITEVKLVTDRRNHISMTKKKSREPRKILLSTQDHRSWKYHRKQK